MTNWTIFLLNAMASMCYFFAGVIAAEDEDNNHEVGAAFMFILGIVLTATAAWI